MENGAEMEKWRDTLLITITLEHIRNEGAFIYPVLLSYIVANPFHSVIMWQWTASSSISSSSLSSLLLLLLLLCFIYALTSSHT